MKNESNGLNLQITLIEKHYGITSKSYAVKDGKLEKEHTAGIGGGKGIIVSYSSLMPLVEYMQKCNDEAIYNRAFTLAVPSGKTVGEPFMVMNKACARKTTGAVSLTKDFFLDYPKGIALMGLDYDPPQDEVIGERLYLGFPPERYIRELASLLPELDFRDLEYIHRWSSSAGIVWTDNNGRT